MLQLATKHLWLKRQTKYSGLLRMCTRTIKYISNVCVCVCVCVRVLVPGSSTLICSRGSSPASVEEA